MTASEQHPEQIDRLLEHRQQDDRRKSKRRTRRTPPTAGTTERRQSERRQTIRRTGDFPRPSPETSIGTHLCPDCGTEFLRLSSADSVRCPGCGQKLL